MDSLDPSLTDTRRAELVQLFVYIPALRVYLSGGEVDSKFVPIWRHIAQQGDAELAVAITDAEVAEARRTAAARFADVFPAGI